MSWIIGALFYWAIGLLVVVFWLYPRLQRWADSLNELTDAIRDMRLDGYYVSWAFWCFFNLTVWSVISLFWPILMFLTQGHFEEDPE